MALTTAKNKLGKLIKQGKKATYPQLVPHIIKSKLNTFAPFLGAGIRLEMVDLDNGLCVVGLPMTRLNKSLTGTQFGASMHMMTDPFICTMLAHKLGKDYQVWDISSTIEYLGTTEDKVTVRIKISTEEVLEILELAKSGDTICREYHIDITDSHQKIIAKVSKTIGIKRLDKA